MQLPAQKMEVVIDWTAGLALVDTQRYTGATRARRSSLLPLHALAVVTLVFVTSLRCDWTDHPFKPNPKLSLVLNGRNVGTSLVSPVVTPSGTELYYLRCSDVPYPFSDAPGELWKAKIDGSCTCLAMSGNLQAFALSRDGATLALATDSGYVLLADAEGRVEDTVARALTGTLHGVWFSREDSERLYYRVDQLYFAVNLDGSGKHEVSPDAVDGFPWVQRSGRFAVVKLQRDNVHDDLALVDASTGDTTPLDAAPYKRCGIVSEYACWTPDEDAVVFSAFEWVGGDPWAPTCMEIWKYAPVFSH
jgi:hypothetical protein